MTLRQQIIDGIVEKAAVQLELPYASAFLRVAYSLVAGVSLHSIDDGNLVDGGGDKQIDIIGIELNADGATIYILQTKSNDSYSTRDLVSFHNGLRWIFETPRNQIEALQNRKLRDRILEYRDAQLEVGPSNIAIKAAYICNGLTDNIPTEFLEESEAIRNRFDNGTFREFSLDILGADELVDNLNTIEKKERKINEDIRIIYDTNNPSLIKYYASGLKGVVCTTTAAEVARIVGGDPKGHVFDGNIRRFLGTRGNVNSDIIKTCSDATLAPQFWFLNNGITIICDRFDPTTDPDNPHIKVQGMQIVNGCQTASALALAQNQGILSAQVRVLLRIYETDDPNLVDRIVLTTNNQNKISSRDLHANDQIQIDMERRFLDFGYYYERKTRQFDGQDIRAAKIMPNEWVAQCFLAVVLRKPSEARTRKYKVWSELYNSVFSNKAVEQYILASLIVRTTVKYVKALNLDEDLDDIRRKIANNASFHVARATSFYLRGDEWDKDTEGKRAGIELMESTPQSAHAFVEAGFAAVEAALRSKETYASDPDAALKSNAFDSDLDRYLYRTRIDRVEVT